jgi:hypothetical protein
MKNLLPSGVIPQTKTDEIASNLDDPGCETCKCIRASFLTELPGLMILSVTSVISSSQ